MNTTLKDIKERRSIRKYSEKKIDKKILEEIVDAGRLAPSAHAYHPIEFIVVTEKDTLKKLSELIFYGKHIKDAAACIVVISEKVEKYIEDGSAATENILIAAKSFGIGSCWVAGANTEHEEKVKETLKVPQEMNLVSIIPLGYPAESPKAYSNKDLKEILHWKQF